MGKQKLYPSSPLGMIAIFVFFIEAIATVSLRWLVEQNSMYLQHMILFIIFYPSAITMLFFLTLWLKRECLFGPSDYKEDKSFLDTLYNNVHQSNDVSEKPEIMNYHDQSNKLSLMYSNAIAYADAALRASGIDSKHLNQAAELLFRIFYQKNTDKTLAICLGRVLRKLKKYQEAINVLTTFAKSIGNDTDQEKQAKADAYYNIACYYALWFSESKDNDLKKRSLEALRKALYFSPKMKDLVIKDEDFMSISTEKDLLDLLSVKTPISG